MARAMHQPPEDETTLTPLERWERLQRDLDESLAGLSDEERQELADEISEAIKQNITQRRHRGATT